MRRGTSIRVRRPTGPAGAAAVVAKAVAVMVSGMIAGAIATGAADALAANPAPAADVPSGFDDTLVLSVNQPMDIDFTPDGRMLIPKRTGKLQVVVDETTVSTALDLTDSICTQVERGLLGVAVHPDFAANNHIYVFYTFPKHGTCSSSEVDGPVDRISRFTLPPTNVIDPLSELVLLETSSQKAADHHGGDLAFGPDGHLYATIGENSYGSLAQDPASLFGKLVRLTDTGAIPPGNAHTGPLGVRCNMAGAVPPGSPAGSMCQEIYSSGLRNPFVFAVDPNTPTTRLYVNDVGQNEWEEINEVTGPGDNFGWKDREGPCELIDPDQCTPSAGHTDPVHWYPHNEFGGAITGGAFVPSGIWPASFDAGYLFADFVFGKIYKLDGGATGCRLCDPPTSDFTQTEFSDAANVVHMSFGPYQSTQALYYATTNHEIRRIVWTGSGNQTPTAVATASPLAGPAPLSVDFDATASTDPDFDTLTYQWDFDDGSPVSTDPTPTHQFTLGGTYDVELTVDDGEGATDSTTIRIDVDNLPPVPVISSPVPGHEFSVGETLTLTGSATDPEDGTLTDVDLEWEVRQHHSLHFHPYLAATVGNDIPVVAPPPEDLLAATNSHLEILLTATDSQGLSTTVSRLVMPHTVDVTVETDPGLLDVVIDSTLVADQEVIVSWEGHLLDITAPHQQNGSGDPYLFDQWSDGGAQNHLFTVPAEATSIEAMFVPGTEITVSPASLDEGLAGTSTLDIPVELAVASNQTVTVDWTTVDGEATAPGDFVAATGQVVFLAGDTSEVVSITVIDDGLHEGDETFDVVFSNPVNAALAGPATVAATIVEDEPFPMIRPFGVALAEGTGTNPTANVVVFLETPSDEVVTADWQAADIPSNPSVAHPGIDLIATTGSVTFLPGETQTTVPIEIIADSVDEPPLLYGEWGFLAFGNPSANAMIDYQSFFGLGLIIIFDDD